MKSTWALEMSQTKGQQIHNDALMLIRNSFLISSLIENADSEHYFAGNVLSDSVDGAPDNNRFLGPTLQAIYLLVTVCEQSSAVL